MKTLCKTLLLFVFFMSLLVSCKKTRDDYPLSNLRAISAFEMKYYHNSDCNLYISHKGKVDETNRAITVSVPKDADLTKLQPTVSIAPWATVSPASLQEVDFSKGPVEYTVTAQSGKKAYYTVTVTADYVYTKAELVRLYLADIPSAEDPQTPVSGVPASYKDNAKLGITVASTYDLSSQRAAIDLSAASHGAKVEVKALDDPETSYTAFTNLDRLNFDKTIVFRVTPQSGSAIRYQVTVTKK